MASMTCSRVTPIFDSRKAVTKMTVLDGKTGQLVILLVDDEPGIRMMLSMLLEEEGYQVITARDGREALKVLDEIRPDLMITDYMMPHVTGTQLITTFRSLPGCDGIPVLLMSAALPGHIDPGALAVPFMGKPADLGQLLALIEQLIERASRPADSGC